MIVDKYGNYVRKCMWQLCGQDRVDICLTIHSRTILKIVKSMCNDIKNQMHPYEMSYKCQLYPFHTFAT
jgi:hypothetical protein